MIARRLLYEANRTRLFALSSIIGIATLNDEPIDEPFEIFGRKKTREPDQRDKTIDDDFERDYDVNYSEDTLGGRRKNADETPRRKRVRVRIPVVRSRSDRQHKYTVVRRRPLQPYSSRPNPIVEPLSIAKRIVVTRVRPLGPAIPSSTSNEIFNSEIPPATSSTRHRVTVTRSRKLRPTSIAETTKRPRVTRKKLLTVRPVVEPTATFAIITTGFYSAPSSSGEYDYDYDDESETDVSDNEEFGEHVDEPKIDDNSVQTPNLNETPNIIDNEPEEEVYEDDDSDEPSKFELDVPEESSAVDEGPVIITDHFFYPPSVDDEDEAIDTTTASPEESSDDVTIEEPTTTGFYEDENSADVETELPETTTTRYTSEEPDNSKNVEEDIKEKMEDTFDVSTETLTTVTDYSDSDDSTTSVTEDLENINEDGEDQPTTQKTIDDSMESPLTTIPDTTVESVTSNIDEQTTDATFETTSDVPSTPRDEQQPENEEPMENSTTMGSEEVTDDQTTTSNPTDSPDIDDEVSDATPQSVVDEFEILTTTESSEEDDLSVIPLEESIANSDSSETLDIKPTSTWSSSSKKTQIFETTINRDLEGSEIPSVIPLEPESHEDTSSASFANETSSVITTTTNYESPTTEDIEAGLTDDLYLSLSRPDFPQIDSSNTFVTVDNLPTVDNFFSTPELSTTVFYTETVVTSTKLRTYTYVVTKLNGLETEVTSSMTVRPRVTTLTLTVPVTVTITPTPDSPTHVTSVYSPVSVAEHETVEEEEGRRFNLATRIMSNGVEVIVAGPTPALRWENSNPQPTLTPSDTVVMLMPQEVPNEFVTKTCTTTFTYLNTITKDGATIVSTDQQVVANTATEERHRKPGTESASVTLEASPTLRTEVFKTTYTYLTLNTDHPDVNNALGSSMKVITNTVTAPQHYLDMLEPSEATQPETNTYLSTRLLEKTFMEDGKTRIKTTSDTVTQLIITESAPPPPRPTSVATTLTALDDIDDSMTETTKTYLITYTYYNTYLEKGSTVIRTNVATSTDIVLEKIPTKITTMQSVTVTPTPEPIQIFATKTYLTTFTYFTTLLQAGADGETSTTISSRSHIVENVVTESIAPSLLDPGYMNALLTTAHHSDSVKNVVTGSTIIFFDEEDQIDPTTATSSMSQATVSPSIEKNDGDNESTSESSQSNPTSETIGNDGQSVAEPIVTNDSQSDNTTSTSNDTQNKRPSSNPITGGDLQVSNLLSLGSLGINSLSALGPVITAMADMAGLLQSKTTATRRNDTVPAIETQEVTTQRSPIYIPVAEFADGDIETAESQNIVAQLANPGINYIPETRHKVAASLADGIPISPGEVITANSDVIIGKPGKLGPRPPHSKTDEHIGMKPPPIPVPNIPVHPVLEVIRDDEMDSQSQSTTNNHRNTQIQILSAHQVYEKHLKIPGPSVFPPKSQNSGIHKRPHQIQSGPSRLGVNKHDSMRNDPLMKPPDRPNVEHYANPNINPKDTEWNRDRLRRPWSAKDPLTPPLPPIYDGIQTESSQEAKPWPHRAPIDDQKRPLWAQKDPLTLESNGPTDSLDSKPNPSEPIIHQVPHVIDRSTGQPLLVNIQPSQVANVVIPQGGTQALIFGDTNEPHISGQYFDDPSPYPEPESSLGFVKVEKIENNPADYMTPPAPPLTFKPLPTQKNHHNHPPTIPLSHGQFTIERPHENSGITTNTRHDKRPSEVLLIQRPDTHGQSSGQGHVHTEILVHHRPETVNIRHQAVAHKDSHKNSQNNEPPRRNYSGKHSRPGSSTSSPPPPPRRSEIHSGSTDVSHQYIYVENKPHEPVNDSKFNWKYDRKPIRNPTSGNRPERRPERPSVRPHQGISPNYPIFERPGSYANRKPQYQTSPSRNPSSNNFSNNPNWNSNSQNESSKKPIVQSRPSQYHSKSPRPNESTNNLPTGAVGYYNPSLEQNIKIIDATYNLQSSTVKPKIQSLGEILPHRDNDHVIPWQIDTQTERTSSDSSVEASNPVRYNEEPHVVKTIDHEHVDDRDSQTIDVQTSSSSNDVIGDNVPYDTVGSVNTVVGKPVDMRQTMSYETQNKNPLNFGHQQEHPGHVFDQDNYDSRPNVNPIVQGKPYAVHDDRKNYEKPFGHHQIDEVDRPDYEVIRGVPFSQRVDDRPNHDDRPNVGNYDRDVTVDLKPPAVLTQFGHELSGRPFARPNVNDGHRENRPASRPRPNDENIRPHGTNDQSGNVQSSNDHISITIQDHPRPGDSQNSPNVVRQHSVWNEDSRDPDKLKSSNSPITDNNDRSDVVANNGDRYEKHERPRVNASSMDSYFPLVSEVTMIGNKADRPTISSVSAGTRIHPAYPHILTKPRPIVPPPITITSSGSRRPENREKSKIRFSMPVESFGEEKDSKTQTERPPSMLTKTKDKTNEKNTDESLETAYQTNFATSGSDNVDRDDDEGTKIVGRPTETRKEGDSEGLRLKVPSQNMMPPPVRKSNTDHGDRGKNDEGLKPPPLVTEVVGLSPPPVAVTTTGRPKDDRFAYDNVDETGMRPPPKYIPLEKSVRPVAQSQSTRIVTSTNLRPSVARPFLDDRLSQDMLPPPIMMETTMTGMEIATVRPAIAVSGSIQIATAVAASHIPVMQDHESKIPIIHGTVDLPVVVDVSDIMKPLKTKKPELVSIYTVRPFETRPISRVSVQPTTKITSNLIMPTKLRPPQIDHVETARPSIGRIDSAPTRTNSHDVLHRPTKRPDHPVFLEPSRPNLRPSVEIKATQTLNRFTNRDENSRLKGSQIEKYTASDTETREVPTLMTRVHSSITRVANTLIPRRDKLPNIKDYAGTVIHEVVKNGTTATVEMKPKAVTHYRTLTVTRTETSVLGTPPTTRTLLLTHTLTSTIVETVTETLLRPTSVVATVTSTILQSVTRLPNSYDNNGENDSIFVVMSDQNPPAAGAEEVEAEYGDDEVSRDEQDPVGNEIHRVLAGGILGAPVVPMRPALNHCQPECKASKAEVCSTTGTEARCVCRPGFARMFPDRPCKPTYTYTLRVGLDRVGHEQVFYEAALNDTSSTAFRRLAGPTKEALDRTMMQSDLRDVYRSLDIAGFAPNPTQVEFHVQLTDNANETRLKDVLRKYLIGSNYSLGGTEVYAARDLEMIDARDFDECSMQDGGPHHDCSPNAACFNLRGSYQCSCREGWADLSENPSYPGRMCSQAPLGCAICNNKGHCATNVHGNEVCECFPWHSGQRCQINLKVLLIVLVTVGATLLGLLAICLGLACFRHPGRRGKSGDRRAMIPGTAGDTSSEGSVADLAIPHHVPHVLPPPPRSAAPAPPSKRPARKITPNGRRGRSPRKASIATTVPANEEHRDRSLTVMIPRAKYRSTQQSPPNYKSGMSTFAADEHKLLSYLESGTHQGIRKPSLSNTKNVGKSYEDSGIQMVRSSLTPSGALVSAGFQVSATVTRPADAESTMARSCAETAQLEPLIKSLRNPGLDVDVGSTLARSCGDTSTSTKLLRLDFGDSSGSTMAKSCGDTTIQTSTKHATSRRSDSKDTRDARDSCSDGRTTIDRDLGSTLRLTSQHSTLYKLGRTSDRDSNFDSL